MGFSLCVFFIIVAPGSSHELRPNRGSDTIGTSRITFHHFPFGELFFVIISSWLTSSKNSGWIISRNLSDLHLLPHLPQHTQSLHQKILGELFFVKISCALHQNILLGKSNGGFSEGGFFK